MSDRLFSEQEATQIVQLAASLQEAKGDELYKPGVTKAELERIAQEVGVSKTMLDEAIARLQTGSPTAETKKVGPAHVITERVFDGELDPEDHDIVTELFGNAFGPMGGSTVGKTLTCYRARGGANHEMTITARGGRTRVRVKTSATLHLVLGLELGIFSLIGGIAAAATSNFLPGILAILAGGATLLWLALNLKKVAEKRNDEVMKILCDGVQDRLREQEKNQSP